VAGNRADEARFARIVAERPADRADGLAERALGHDDVAPHPIEDVAAVHGLVPVFDEVDEQIEIARDQRLLASLANEHPPLGRDDEITKPITRHNRNARLKGSRRSQ
jgi:hypothetical protein